MQTANQLTIPFMHDGNSKDTVVMRHDFEDARYSLSNMGQKILYEILAKLDSFSSAEDQLVCLTAAELEELGIGFSKTNIYTKFESACDEVQNLKVYFIGEDKEHIYKGSVNIFRGNVTKFKKTEGKPKLTEAFFSISKEAAPYLTELTKDMRFTRFLISHTRKLKKASSMRLYQWLRKNHWLTIKRPNTVVEIKVDELRAKLDNKGSYRVWRDFKRRVLDVAVNEVNELSDIRCTYEQGQIGRARKIITLIFTIWNAEDFEPVNDPEAKEIEGELLESGTPQLDDRIKTLVQSQIPNINDEVLKTLAIYEKEVIMEALLVYIGQATSRKIKDPIKYFIGIVTKKVKEHKLLTEGKSNRTTTEKLTDTSWAEGEDFYNDNII